MSAQNRTGEVVAVQSRISAIADDTLTYRGIAIEELFARSTFEETVFLLWFGQLPTHSDMSAFRQRIAETPRSSDAVRELLRLAAPGGLTRALEAGVLGIGLQHAHEGDAIELPLLLLAGIPSIVATFDRQRRGLSTDIQAGANSISEDFLTAWMDRPPLSETIRGFDRGLILIADHELNAATFAARVAASTGADPISVVLAAIATQSGPLHGGAMVEAGRLLRSALAGDALSEVDRRLAAGERIPGFGHSVYRAGDPRATLFRQLVVETAERDGDRRWLETADQVSHAGTERIGLLPNLDLYAAAFWSALGIPEDLFPAIFAIGRVAGWIAHVREQAADNRLIRPRAHYIGRHRQPYVPIEDRGEWFTQPHQ